MNFEYSPYLPPLIVAAIVSAVVAIYAWFRRSANGALALSLMATSIFIWTFGYTLEIAGTNIETKYIWGVIQYFGIAFAPYSWLLFSIAYSDRKKLLTRRFIALTVLIPVITVLLALTTRWNGLIWSEYHIERHENFSALGVTHGTWFIVHFAYSYLSLLIGTILLSIVLLRRKGMYQGQVVAMLVAVLAPWISNVLYLTGNSPIPYLDPTPFAFTISVVALAWAIFGFHLVDITPLARDHVIDSLREGMIVINMRGHVVDANEAAAHMIGVPTGDAIGKTAADIFSPWPELIERFRNVTDARDEITVGEGAAKRHYEVRFSPLQNPQGELVGRVIMLRTADEGELPEPRFAPRPTASAASTRPLSTPKVSDSETAETTPTKLGQIWGALFQFFNSPVKENLQIPNNTNPSWYQTRERLFTIILRIAALLGSISLVLSAVGLLKHFSISLFAFAFILILLWILGLLRNIRYELRVGLFLALIYSLGLVEMLNYGFSVEGFTFFMTFSAISAILTTRRGALHALTAELVTMTAFALLIGAKIFTPFASAQNGTLVSPTSLLSGINSLMVFAACASAVVVSVGILLENLNNAWRKETQALNLLQQERDLLEQHVEERTNELRKYFRAIEQSGNTIVITDTKGNIEYANPRFEQSTGYTVAEARGNNPRVLKSGRQSADYYSQLWQTISGGKVWTGEFLNKRKDGSLYWESATIAPVLDQDGIITNYVAIKEDITARRQAEEQLEKLSQAVEQSGNTVIVMDKNGVIEYVNPKFIEVTGYSAEDAIGKSPVALMNSSEQNPDFTQAEWWQTVNAGQIWHGEFRNHRKDGSEFWESATIAPVFNRDNEIINFVEIKQDITEQKNLQEQLLRQNDYLSILHQITLDLLNHRELKDLLQVIVDQSAALLDVPYSELVIEKDGYLVVEAFTENMQSVKGDRATREQARLSWQAFDTQKPVVIADYSSWKYKREIYESMSMHASADFPVMAGDRCLGVLSVGRSQPNYPFNTDQIETGILFARLVALVLDNANLYDSAMKELAERKRAEALLSESEARFRQIVENASDIIYRVDVHGNFTYINPAALKIAGFANEKDAIGKSCYDVVVPEYRPKIKRLYVMQYLKRTKSLYTEFPILTMEGHIAWIGQNTQLIMDNENIVGFQAVSRNITQLKQAQDALELSRDQALDASRFKSQLLSRVSHELRTPLGGILGYAELLDYQMFGPLTEKQRVAVSNILESTNYLSHMVNDLLDESQIESKSLALHNATFKLADLLDKIKSTMAPLAKKKGLRFTGVVEPGLPSQIYGDINRLQQIIINLTGNAVKFTKEGEVSIRFKCSSPTQWSIEVADTGAGIPASEQQNIFEPFRQVDNSITRENRGSGLGLAITRQLVELMGGSISLVSEVDKGSLFTVTLPIAEIPGKAS